MFREARPPARPDAIERLEQSVGRRLPAEYREFLIDQDGGRAEDNSLAVDEIFGVGDDAPYSRNIWSKLDVFSGRYPEWLLPVAQDVYGNLFALSMRQVDFGSVWFWDHEEEADEGEPPSDENISRIADTWSKFLRGAQPITAESGA